MTRMQRIVTVTAGLFAAGAVVGAITGSIVVAVVGSVMTRSTQGLELGALAVGALFGAPLGAVLFPTAGWLLMRHVPLGRALLWTAIGTVAGALVGWLLPMGGGFGVVERTLALAVVGFALATLVLRRLAPGTARQKASSEST